jgi:imidazolonepropionase
VKLALAAGRVVTCDPARAATSDALGVIEDGAVVIDGGAIADVGTRAEVMARRPDIRLDFDRPDAIITPGFVDAHTHAPWVGSRDGEYALRMGGADYEAIARGGGGIVASMRAIRGASRGAVALVLAARLARMARLGVTTVEAKSGYGLDLASERKQLEAIAEVAQNADLPRLVPTYLALHALPPEAGGDRARYSEEVASSWLPSIAAARLARFVDVYVDRNAFSVAEARPVLEKARSLGLGVRVHAGQFSDVGAAELAADVEAASADHLEVIGSRGIAALAKAGARAVLLPIAAMTLGQEPPPVAALRAAGVPIVVASDSNPGTAPTESLPLALALGARLFGLTVAEVVLGVTREAAASLGLAEVTGVLRTGLAADVVAWDLPHENALIQPWGVPRAERVFRDGRRIA